MRASVAVALVLTLVSCAAHAQTAAELRKARRIRALLQLDSGGASINADMLRGLGPATIVNRLDYTTPLQTGTLSPLQTGCLTAACQNNGLPVFCTASSSSFLVQMPALGVVIPGDPGSSGPADYHCVACFVNTDSTNAQTIAVRPVCWARL